MNVLLCIGCDKYDRDLTKLGGAEKDAKTVFDTLCNGNFYSDERSKLLLSPRLAEVTAASLDCLRFGDVEIFTFFFAGHAGGKNGSFYLCLKDTEITALSATAFPMARLFEMINEFHPRQVNVIVDGCESGGSSLDIRTLLRPEEIGTIRASSITFLGACAADQFALETSAGGVLTTHFLRVLRGETPLVLSKPIIELTDLAAYISDLVANSEPDQRPIWWGLNLFGRGGLARNPKLHIDSPLPSLYMTTVDPDSAMGKRVSAFSGQLWKEYRAISEEFEPCRLNRLLGTLLAPDELAISDRVAAIAGILESFSVVAAAEKELLAKHRCRTTCLAALLPWAHAAPVCNMAREQIRQDFEETHAQLRRLLVDIQENDSCLLAHNGLLADLYYLPVRITKLLGLLGMFAIVADLLGIETPESKAFQYAFIKQLVKTYRRVLVSLDDEQAAPLYIFLKAAKLKGWDKEAEGVIQAMYLDAAINSGKINRLGSDGAGAFEHVLVTSKSEMASKRRMPANPVFLLPVIFLGGVWFDCSEDWNLRAFDRRNLGMFFPVSFFDFSEEVISEGQTVTNQVGFGIWHVKELSLQFANIIKARPQDGHLTPEAHCLCMFAAMLFPNRIPFNLEHIC